TAGRVNVDRDIESGFFFQVVQCYRHRLHWLVLKCERQTESGHNSDGVFVATPHDLGGRDHYAVTLAKGFLQLNVKITTKLVPTNLHGPANQIGATHRLASAPTPLTPPALEG